MSTSQAILVGAALIAASIIFVNTIRPAEAQRIGPFEMVHGSNTSSNTGAFRMDTSTGEMSYCFVAADASLVCTRGLR